MGLNLQSTKQLSLPMLAVAGGFAGACCGAVMGPFELIKCQLQAEGRILGPVGCVKQVIQNEGLQGLLRGTGSTVGREVPFNFVPLGAYELNRVWIDRATDSSTLR